MGVLDIWRTMRGRAAREESRQAADRRRERGHERAWKEIRAKKSLASELRAAGMGGEARAMECEAEEIRRSTAEASLLDGLGIKRINNGRGA